MLSAGRPLGPSLPPLRRVLVINAGTLAAATLALALSPVTVSAPIALTEALLLCGGVVATLTLDALLLRRAFQLAPRATESARPAGTPPSPAAAQEIPSSRPSACQPRRPEIQAADDDRAARLLVCWLGPARFSDADAEAWARAELSVLLAPGDVDKARLSRLQSASRRQSRPWDWLLEVDFSSAGDVAPFVASERWRCWLADLRLLGLRPAALVATGARLRDARER
jgi:hypothetical protein